MQSNNNAAMPSSRNAKRRRKQTAGSTTSDVGAGGIATTSNKGGAAAAADTTIAQKIELLDRFQDLRKTWPKDMARLFDPALSDDRRAELWEIMCEGGDRLRQRYFVHLWTVLTSFSVVGSAARKMA